jgi:threonine dehydrogenase-like Zn-dependent dehydrogenase
MDVSAAKPSVLTAAIVTAPGRIELVEGDLPRPTARQVRIRLEGCGVCASNLTPWSGPDWMQFPTEPGGLGHEGWGLVDAIGPEVCDIRVGDRVAALSYHAYASHDLADEDMVVRLPASLDGQPFPGEPLGCAMNIFSRSKISKDDTVGIVGVGFLGALLTQLARATGARVIAVSRRRFALDVAKEMGATHMVPLDEDPIDTVKSLTNGRFCDVVIECTGKQGPLDVASEITRERGRLVIAGYHQDGPRQVNMQLWNWRGLDVINAHERDPRICIDGIRHAIRAVNARLLDPSSLYTHFFPLEQLDDALNTAARRPDGFVKALITT